MNIYSIDYTGEDRNKPVIRNLVTNEIVRGPFPPGAKIEIVQDKGHTYADIWHWDRGFHSFSHTSQLD